MVGATQRGLTIDDIKEMDIGDIVDYCIEYNNMMSVDSEPSVRQATQADFDNW
jgi:hypothetical protein